MGELARNSRGGMGLRSRASQLDSSSRPPKQPYCPLPLPRPPSPAPLLNYAPLHRAEQLLAAHAPVEQHLDDAALLGRGRVVAFWLPCRVRVCCLKARGEGVRRGGVMKGGRVVRQTVSSKAAEHGRSTLRQGRPAAAPPLAPAQ